MRVLGKHGLVLGRQATFGIEYVAEQEVAPLRALAIMFAKVARSCNATQRAVNGLPIKGEALVCGSMLQFLTTANPSR